MSPSDPTPGTGEHDAVRPDGIGPDGIETGPNAPVDQELDIVAHRTGPDLSSHAPVDQEIDVVAHHQPDQVARDAAAADDVARAAGYSDEALETLRMVTAGDDEITDEQRTVRDKTAKSMMLVGIRTVVVRALGLLGTIFLARLLSPSDYGVVALGLTLVVLGRFFADGGVAPGLIRRETPPTLHEYGALLGFQQAVLWPVSIVASLLCFTVFDLGGTAGSATVSLMLVATIIDVMRSANSIAAERDLEYSAIIRAEIIEFAVFNVLAIGLVAGGTGIIGVGIANIARSLTGSGLVILWGPLGWVKIGWDFKVIRALARFGIFFQLSWLATLFRDQGLALILAAVSGRASLGAFDQARRLLVIVTLVFESAWRVGLPGLARMMEAGAAPKMLFQRGLGLAGVAMTFPVVGLVATCHWLVPCLLGDGWRETTLLIPWVGAAIMLTMPIATIISTLLWARDEPKKVFYMGMPALAGTLAIGALAMTKYDAVGAGIGLTAGGVIYVASCIYYATDVFGPKTIPQFLGPILAATGACFAGYLVGQALAPSGTHWIDYFVGVIISGVVSVAALLALLTLLARSASTDLLRFAGKARG